MLRVAFLVLVAGLSAQASISRPLASHVRVMTWNISDNSIFDDPGLAGRAEGDRQRPARFKRIVRAIDPDVICLQEIFPPRSAADAASVLDATLPLGDGARWQVQQTGDAVIAARFPLSMRAGRLGDFGGRDPRAHTIALVDLPDQLFGRDLYTICAHFPSRGEVADIAARQRQADVIAAWLRDARTPGGEVDIPRGTPIVLFGDWNAYKTDPAQHMTTLLTGAISNTGLLGEGMLPDWDGSPLREATAWHNGEGSASYTFGDGGGDYPPSALDRVLFTDSVAEAFNAFVLNTTTLPPGRLAELGLEAADVLLSAKPRRFDHLPVVVDFRITGLPERR